MENRDATQAPAMHHPMAGLGYATGSMVSSQLGIAFAVPLMLVHGSFGISAMRLAFAGVFCLAWARPDVRRFDRRQWLGALALGAAMAWMTMCYFTAARLIPMGAAITIDFLGPLGVAVLSLRGWPRLLLPLAAGLGVLAVSYGKGHLVNPEGIVFALGAGCGWAGYIVLMRHVGRLFTAQEGLCISLLFAAALAVPAACVLEPPASWLGEFPLVIGLALMSPLLPFAFEMAALRRMEMGVFSIVMSMEPALGALFGYWVLKQALSLQQIGGVLVVMAASAVAVLLPIMGRSARQRRVTGDLPAICTLPGE